MKELRLHRSSDGSHTVHGPDGEVLGTIPHEHLKQYIKQHFPAGYHAAARAEGGSSAYVELKRQATELIEEHERLGKPAVQFFDAFLKVVQRPENEALCEELRAGIPRYPAR